MYIRSIIEAFKNHSEAKTWEVALVHRYPTATKQSQNSHSLKKKYLVSFIGFSDISEIPVVKKKLSNYY